MAKSRSEIQKAYRERQKAKGDDFLRKEKLRQRTYYTPAAELTEKKRKERNKKNKMRNRLSRLRKKTSNEQERSVIENTSGYESFQELNQEQHEEQTPGPSHLIVRLPLKSNKNKAKGVKKRRKLALTSSYSRIKKLKLDNENLRKTLKIRNRRIQRLQKKTTCISNQQLAGINITPRKQTDEEVEKLNLTPKRQRQIRKKLLTLNTLTTEINEARETTSTKKRESLSAVVSGRIAKKYRCVSSINKATGLSRKSLSKVINKDITSLTTKVEIRSSLAKKLEKSVHDFFDRDDNSRAQPGKADAKKVNDIKRQTRVLTDYMRNLHEKYLSENPDVKISLSTFQRLRPKHILLTSMISRNSCQCIHHQNMALKVQAIRKAGIKIGLNPEHLMDNRVDLKDLLKNLPENVTYKVWKKVQIEPGKTKMKVIDQDCAADTFRSELERQLQSFTEHVKRVREQYQQVRTLKGNLKDNEMILQMDFAENYSCRSLDEVQTAYWNQSMVTLHPIVAYYKDEGELKHQSFVVVSDEMSHSAGTVCAFIDKVMPKLKLIKPCLEKVHYWTDSPSSQYRNRYMFYTIANHKELHGVGAIWNYFEVGHGKGPCDGLGGTVKRMADEAIKQGRVSIQDAAEFYTWAEQSNLKGVQFMFVSKSHTKSKQERISRIKGKPFKGTMKWHAIAMTGDKHILMARETSCYCDGCLQGLLCNTWQTQSFEYSDEEMEVDNSEQQDEDVGESTDAIADVSSREDASVSLNADSLEIDKYIAAEYDGKWYVGQIVDNDDNEVEVNFMTRAKSLFKWPQKQDRIWISKDNVLCEISPPVASGKSERLFKLSKDDQEKIDTLYVC